MVVLQLLYTYTAPMNRMFHSAPIDLASWGRILVVGIIIYLAVGVEKWIRRNSRT